MYIPKSYHFFTLLLCSFCFKSCNKETEKPTASIPYFTLNDSTLILPNAALRIESGCKEYNIQPRSEPEGASIFVAINDNNFSALQNPIILQDSIHKISAYAIHPGYEKSAVVSLNINFEPNVFTGTTTLFPNPASDHVTFRTENPYRGLTKLTFLDIYGSVHHTSETEKVNDTMELTVDVSDFPAGLLIYKLEYEACELNGKLIIDR